MIIKTVIPLPSNCTYEAADKSLLIKFNQGVDLNLSWSNLVAEVIGEEIHISYLKKWDFLARPIVITWTNLLKKYSLNPIFTYIVTPISKHFPIRLDIEGNSISVFNYLGLKKKFYVKLSNIKSMELKHKEIHITSTNDIITGSQLNLLKAIRYKTHHRKLDRRIFTDGFKINKTWSH